MKEIPTARELFKPLRGSVTSYPVGSATYINIEDAIKFSRKFAKLHVDAALRAAHSNAQLPSEDIDFTLECYPEQNIK